MYVIDIKVHLYFTLVCWIQHLNRMPRYTLHRLIQKSTPQKAEGTKEDH
jgi:hypothetical protein